MVDAAPAPRDVIGPLDISIADEFDDPLPEAETATREGQIPDDR